MAARRTPREHIECIRKDTFNIGQEPGLKDVFLHHAINYLSAELYAKDVHFLMELIQNAEDNEYLEGVKPSLEFLITSQDITATGAPATLLVFNNEKGFSPKNIESICALGCSTKKGNRKRGYIGEKGIGFKSVFLITARPYIFSNGYQIRFSEEPCPHCKVGFIVPEWVYENPTLSTIKQIYGSDSSLPTTTFVLPLKPDKVRAVKQQLSSIHPEILLFLSKIKRLSVKEDNEDPKLNSVSAISISSETEFAMKKNIDAVSYKLHLSADENSDCSEKECIYHMWRQRFPVKAENKVEKRMEVEEWVLTLAFPFGRRLNRGSSTSPGVYAFLPTEMVTNFPFIIQADFLLPSSRETILLDNKWNQGILDCVPSAFINALISLVKSIEGAPLSSLACMFEFLPINSSPYPEIDAVREIIKTKLANESIVPCESYMAQKLFRKPSEVGRLMPAFWNILNKARQEGVSLHHISSHGRYVLSSSFDRRKYDKVLNFLGVSYMGDEWYANCILGSNLVFGVSEELYLELLDFVAGKWKSNFQKTSMRSMPLIKFVSLDGNVSLMSVNEISQQNVRKFLLSDEYRYMSWLIDWNREFRCPADCSFVPKSLQEAIKGSSKWRMLLEWLSNELGVKCVNVYEYATLIADSIKGNTKLVVAYAHFLHHSLSKNYMSEKEINLLCGNMPLVDNYGRLTKKRRGVLVPASGSKWVSLLGLNLWRKEDFVELGEDYLRAARLAGVYTSEKELINFLKSHLGASDVPDISPPDAIIPTLSAPLTRINTFLLLDWIRNLKGKRVAMPSKFIKCIKEESWMKISMSGSPGYRPPSLSFFPSSSWGYLLQDVSVLVDIPIMDKSWYGEKINDYTEELKAIGLMFEFREACQFFGKHVVSLSSSSTLTREHVVSILKFIKFLRENFLSSEDFIDSIKEGRWLQTSNGYRFPTESVLHDQEWDLASEISDIPFIAQDYYGEEILHYKSELQMLGVVVGFNHNYQLVVDNLKSPAHISAQTNESGLFVLKCLSNSSSPERLVQTFKNKKFLKTNMGYRAPFESYLLNPEWGCLLQVFNSFPLIDDHFYGSDIFLYKNELKQLGVKVEFEEATKAFAHIFKQQSATYSITKGNVLSLLACFRKLKGTTFKFPKDLKKCFREVKWLRTRLGDYRVPRDCLLFGSDWESIDPISLLPFIDDGDKYYGKDIYEYEKELKSLGVVVAFKDGYKFVDSCIFLPSDLSSITPPNAYALLECIRSLKPQNNECLPDSFLKKIGKKWVKTTIGYRSPDKCLLFDSNWSAFLEREDGPFIDEEFYGSKIKAYSKELNAIGVTIEVKSGCSLLASFIDFHSELNTIVRIYNYLGEFNWKPESEDQKKIWVPNGNGDGKWAKPNECVILDEDQLFATQFNVLEKHYDHEELFGFFSCSLDIKSHPSLDDYCKLWNVWEKSEQRLSHHKCCAFWRFVVKNWSSNTKESLLNFLLKVPVDSGSDGILLLDKRNVFVADDLLLKDLFQQFSLPLFIWLPQSSSPSLPRFKLLEVYREIGVQKISESVKKEEISVINDASLKQVEPSEFWIRKGLLSLILGFLSGPSLNMKTEKRHEVVKRLLSLTVLETEEPITISYSLSLSSVENLKSEAKPMIRWERESKKIITQKMNKLWGHKSIIEYATYFSSAISEGLLWENEDHIHPLAELIKLGFLVKFDEEAIKFLMKSKNLQLFKEDDMFLSSVFMSD